MCTDMYRQFGKQGGEMTIREIAEKYAKDGWSGDADCVSIEDCEAAIREALELAAKECEEEVYISTHQYGEGYSDGARTCAARIRALKGEK